MFIIYFPPEQGGERGDGINLPSEKKEGLGIIAWCTLLFLPFEYGGEKRRDPCLPIFAPFLPFHYDPLWHRDKKESTPPPYTHTPIVLLPPPFGVGFTQEFSLLKVRSLKKGYLLNGKKWVFFVNGV